MSRIVDLVARLCSGGVEFKRLGEIGRLVRGNGMPKTVFTDSGVGAIHYGQIYTRYDTWTTETLSFVAPETAARLAKVDPGDVIITNTSENLEDVGKAVAWLGATQVVTGGHATVLKHFEDPKFIAYWLQTPAFSAQKKRLANGTKVIDVSARALAQVRVPVPPVVVQREIVKVLDVYRALEQELRKELEQELAARQSQHAYYRARVLGIEEPSSIGESSETLSDIVDFINGKAHERLVSPDGTVALLTARFISTAGKAATRRVSPKDVLSPARRGDIAMVMSDLPNGRALARCFYVEEDGRYVANQRVCLLRVRDAGAVDTRYLYHFLNRNPQLLAFDNGQDQTHLKKGQILGIRVPTVPRGDQDEAVSTLDQLDAGTRDLVFALQAEQEARRKQYEHYRDRLLTFDEATA